MPQLQRTRLIPLGGGNPYASYVTSLAPLLWLRLRETSGTIAANSGSLGSAQDGTIIGTMAMGQTGQLGANEAFLYDALTNNVQVTRTAAMDGIAKLTLCFLSKPNSVGENSSGVVFRYANNAGNGAFINVNRQIDMSLASTGNARSQSSINFLPAYGSAWYWLFMQYDNVGDRLIHLFKGLAGAITEATYAVNTAATGTLSANNGATMNFGNRLALDNTWDGLIDEIVFFDRILTPAEMLQTTLLSGLAA